MTDTLPARLFTVSRAWKIAILLLLGALALALTLDRPIMEYLLANRFADQHKIFRIGRELGKGEYPLILGAIIWGATFAAYLILRRNLRAAWRASLPNGRKALLIVLAVVSAGIIVNIVKFLLARPRPLYAFENNRFGLEFFETTSALHSFPSGHTSTQAALIFSLMVFFPRLFWPLALIGAFWVTCNSVVLAHWPSDLLGGIAFTLLAFAYIRQIFPTLQ